MPTTAQGRDEVSHQQVASWHYRSLQVTCPLCGSPAVPVRPAFAGAGLSLCPTCRDVMEGLHAHLDLVVLPDGTAVTAASYFSGYERQVPPEFALYFDKAWAPPWPHDHVGWPDFDLPEDAASTGTQLAALLQRARHGQRVEVGCLGGHGRTGTALGCLAVLAGAPSGEAVAWVRSNYCPLAIETEGQAAFVEQFALGPPPLG